MQGVGVEIINEFKEYKMEKDKYASQKKHLSEHKKQLRVWVDPQKYAELKKMVHLYTS